MAVENHAPAASPRAALLPASAPAAQAASRLSPVEQALKAADLLLQSGGFSLVAIDLGDVPPPTARRVPLTSWFRFRRAVEGTPTALVVLEQEAFARTCASLVLTLARSDEQWTAAGRALPHTSLLRRLECSAEMGRTHPQSRAPRSVRASFSTLVRAG